MPPTYWQSGSSLAVGYAMRVAYVGAMLAVSYSVDRGLS